MASWRAAAAAVAVLATACAGQPSAPVCADMSIGGQVCASRELLASSTVLRVWQEGSVPAGGKFVGAVLPASYRFFKNGVDSGSAAAFVSNGLSNERCYNGGSALACALVRTFPMAQGLNKYLAVGYAFTGGSSSTVGTASNKAISSLVPSRVTYLGRANTMQLTVPTANAWGDEVQLIYGTADAKTTDTSITSTPNLVANVSFAVTLAPTTAAPTSAVTTAAPTSAVTTAAPTTEVTGAPTSTAAPTVATATPTAQVTETTGSPTYKPQLSMTRAMFGGKGSLDIDVLDMATYAVQMQLTVTVPAGFNGYVSFGAAKGDKAHAKESIALISYPVNGVFTEPAPYLVLPGGVAPLALPGRRLQLSSPFCNGRPNGASLTGTSLTLTVCGAFGGLLDLGSMAGTGTLIAAFSPSSGSDLTVAHSPQQAAAVALTTPTSSPPTAAPTAAPAPASNTGAIVGGVIGGLVALALIIGGIYYWHKQQQKGGAAKVPASKDVESDASAPGSGEVAKM